MTRSIRGLSLTLAILGSAAACVVLTLTLRRSHPAAVTPLPDEATAAQPRDENNVRMELAMLRNEVARLHGQVVAVAANSGSAPPPAAQPKTPTPEEAAAQDVRLYEKLDARAIREKRDTAWSDKTEAQINEVISAAKTPGSKIQSIACRTSLCEVTIVSQDRDAQSELAQLITTGEPFTSAGGTYFRYGQGATLTTTVYMLRRGAELESP